MSTNGHTEGATFTAKDFASDQDVAKEAGDDVMAIPDVLADHAARLRADAGG